MDLLPGVHCPAEDLQGLYLPDRQAENRCGFLPQGILSFLQGQFNAFDLQHSAAPFRGKSPSGV